MLLALLLAAPAFAARHLIRPSDLPPPGASQDADNPPYVVERRPEDAPQAPPGWKVSLFAEGLEEPRQIRVAPDGDVFVSESRAGRIRRFHDGKPSVFAEGLHRPFGIAFRPGWVYVGDTDAVVRIPSAGGKAERIASLPTGGHWTRDVAFSRDGKTMFVSVGSYSNVSDGPREKDRADILYGSPEGGELKVYASGLRNAVSLAVEPKTGALWACVNERDRLGDDLPPDYVTRVTEGGFYGWPWYYIGAHQDPRHASEHPELRDKVLVPDVLIQAHSAPLGLTFWDETLYVALHGSWNRGKRTGYEVIRLTKDGGYDDFLTGFVRPDGRVWGRPVGVAVSGGALLVTDDASGTIWKVSR